MIPGVTTKLISYSSGLDTAFIALKYAVVPDVTPVEQLNPCVFALVISVPNALVTVGFIPSYPPWNANTNCLLTISDDNEPVITNDNCESNANVTLEPVCAFVVSGFKYCLLSIATPTVSKSNPE